MQDGLVGYFFGKSMFEWQGEILKPPTRKAMALLCYVAVQQRPVQREELTELLWELGENRSLRRELNRLKQLPGVESWLEVTNVVLVHAKTDLGAFREAVKQQDFQKAIRLYQGKAEEQLLAGLEPKNAPVFVEWLESERIKLNALLVGVLERNIEELENTGKLIEAIECTKQLLERDPLNESAHRSIMRQEFKRGNLQAALKQYEACRHALAKELGITPLPETLELAQEIEKAIKQPLPKPSIQIVKTQYRIPPKLLRPPVLVGRESEWAEMEKAWEDSKSILISGTAGSGKTRLMMDFARSKSDNFSLNYGRPGDSIVPYSSTSRMLVGLDHFPSEIEMLEPWVRYELARLAPERFEEKPLPMTSTEESRLRLSEAFLKLFLAALQAFDNLLTDDLHYFDKASFHLGAYCLMNFAEQGSSKAHISCYREEEMPPEYNDYIIELAGQGILTHINLKPLNLEAVTELLVSLEIERPKETAPQLHKLTGGNPQFIVEVLKSLYEQGWQGPELPERISLPKQVSSTIERRLDRLSQYALRLVRVMAVLKEPSGVQAKHLAEIVDIDYLKASEMLAELEQAYIIKDGLFVHDLLFETALSTIPAPIYLALNQSVAKWLETQNAAPARIAHHWIEANEPKQALPWRVKAAEILLIQGETKQACGWLKEVLAVADRESDLHKEARALQKKIGDFSHA